jgi:mRNA interferase MazF
MESRSMTKGKLVLVPFPFDDFSVTKVRPALCLTEPIGSFRHVVLAFLTSQLVTPLLDTDLELEPSHPDFPATGLNGRGTVRLHRMVTTATSLIRRELGTLSPALQVEVDIRLRKVFGL